MEPQLDVINLADRPECLSTLARWHHEQWSALYPGDTLEQRIERMQRHLDSTPLPCTFVACSNQDILGSASLVADDMHRQLDLTPWLASVFVPPAHRRRGIATRLILRVIDEACRQGYPRLYLFTPDQESLYAGLGWTVLRRTTHQDTAVVVMERALHSAGG